MSKKSNKTIGIDLGTTNSCVSIFEGNEVIVIPNSEGKRTTPSIVSFSNGEIKVGDSAKRQAITNPKNTIYSVKRLMGKTYEQVKNLKFPFEVINQNGRPAIKINDKNYSPEEISAMILTKMKKTAENYIGEEIESVVITVPAYFNNEEREATKLAGEIAGLKVERIISEPTSACLSYCLDKTDTEKKIVVYDIGGGTADFSVLEFGNGVFEVLAVDGDLNLGGDVFDEKIIDWLADEFKKDENVDLRKDPMSLQRIKEAAEKAKIELSSSSLTDINLPYITVVDNIPKHLVKTLTRAKFEELIDIYIDKSIQLTKSCLEKAKLKPSDIDDVLLVGGSTRVPKIAIELEKLFGKAPNKSINPDESVSIGATIQGGVLNGTVKDILLLDVLPLNLGIETMGGIFTTLIPANSTIPIEKSEIFSTASDNQPSVELHVLQGMENRASRNRTLGKFNLDSIPPAMRGTPQIQVTFNVDSNSILSVSAKDLGTGKEQKIRIENSTSLSKEEIERMKNEAKENEEVDKKFKEEVEKLNQTESLIFSTEKSLKEYGDKISSDTKTKTEDLVSKLKEAKESKDFTLIDSLSSELQTILSGFYQEIQNNTPSTEETSTTETSSATSDNTEETSYEEVK